MSNIDYKELIEQYLTGTISDANKSALESKLASDVSLRAEMKAQGDMVAGLKEFRKAELKSRLDNVPLEVGVLGTIGQSAFVKVGATVGTALLFVGGMYYFNENPFKDSPKIEELKPIVAYEQPVESHTPAITTLPKVETPAKPASGSEAVDPTKGTTTTTAPAEAVENDKPAVKEEVTPSFNKPSVVEFETDEEFEAEAVGKENALSESSPAEMNKPIDIEVKPETGASKLQYQFYEERLYLYGNFGDVPYEILEINSKDGKRIYLLHQDVYYKLSYPTNKKTDLEKVTNEDLIKELNIFRDNKALN